MTSGAHSAFEGFQGVDLGSDLKLPHVLSAVIAALMTAQAALGRLLEGQYRDVAWIRATWFGNDLVTLLLAVPLLVTALVLVRRGSVRALILWLGLLGYSAYNYAYYMLGAALNAFFPLYVLLLILSVVTLILVVSRIAASQIAASLRAQTPVRVIGGYFIFVAASLSLAWFGMWAAYVFAGRPTPVEPEAFKLVAALDTSIMVSLMGFGGVLLWRRNAWGGIVAGLAGIQGSLYLIVLSVNASVAISRSLVEAPGELPVWGGLAVTTVTATAALLRGFRAPGPLDRRASQSRPA
jgi:hypothetical protein